MYPPTYLRAPSRAQGEGTEATDTHGTHKLHKHAGWTKSLFVHRASAATVSDFTPRIAVCCYAAIIHRADDATHSGNAGSGGYCELSFVCWSTETPVCVCPVEKCVPRIAANGLGVYHIRA